ncbi:hypothetical protein GCM10010402_50960 [Actinomadura luteofluorescens]|nr:hypothetical protein [Actinomadura glauciflava]MCR3742316.1 hypothetical protein [Actinomadura glauciflava]
MPEEHIAPTAVVRAYAQAKSREQLGLSTEAAAAKFAAWRERAEEATR